MEIGKQSSVILIEFSEVAYPSTQNLPDLISLTPKPVLSSIIYKLSSSREHWLYLSYKKEINSDKREPNQKKRSRPT